MRLAPAVLLLGGATLAAATVSAARGAATADLSVKWCFSVRLR